MARGTLVPLQWTRDVLTTGLPENSLPCFFLFFKHNFIYFCLHWVFIALQGLSLVAVNGGVSLQWLLLLPSSGSRHAASIVAA